MIIQCHHFITIGFIVIRIYIHLMNYLAQARNYQIIVVMWVGDDMLYLYIQSSLKQFGLIQLNNPFFWNYSVSKYWSTILN